MDFTSLSATRLEAKTYRIHPNEVELREFQGYQRKRRANPESQREVYNALFSTVDGDGTSLSDNLIDANVSFAELASLTDKDLELIGCKDENQQSSLLEYFQQMPKQDRSFAQIMKSDEAQLYNGVILKRTAFHLEAMRSALAAATYKLKIIPPEDVVVGEKNFASRFVLDALEELERVTDDIDIQLNKLDEQAKKSEEQHKGKPMKKFKVFLSTALVFSIGFLIWKTVRSR